MEDYMEVVQCNSPAIRRLAGSPGNDVISGALCSISAVDRLPFQPNEHAIGTSTNC